MILFNLKYNVHDVLTAYILNKTHVNYILKVIVYKMFHYICNISFQSYINCCFNEKNSIQKFGDFF